MSATNRTPHGRASWTIDMRSARSRLWMPAAANHAIEFGNGQQGLAAYQTRFLLPGNGQPVDLQRHWYTFRVGSVAGVSINNDDVCIEARVAAQDLHGHQIDGVDDRDCPRSRRKV